MPNGSDHPLAAVSRRTFLLGATAFSGAMLAACGPLGLGAPNDTSRWSLPGGTTVQRGGQPVSAADLAPASNPVRHWVAASGGWVCLNPRPIGMVSATAHQGADPYSAADFGLLTPLAAEWAESAVYLPHTLTLRSVSTTSGGTIGWQAPLASPNAWQASEVQVRQASPGPGLVVSAQAPAATPWGDIQVQVTVDMDRYPLVRVTVPSAVGAWSLKVNPGSWPNDLEVIGGSGTTATGTFIADVARMTGWHGQQTFWLKFWAVGNGQPVTLTSLAFLSAAAEGVASAVETSWLPWQIDGSATMADGTVVQYTDAWSSPEVLVRTMHIRPGAGGGDLVLVGDAGSAQWWLGNPQGEPVSQIWVPVPVQTSLDADGTVTVDAGAFSYSIVTDTPPIWRGTAADGAGVLGAAGGKTSTPQSGRGASWGFRLAPVGGPATVRVAVGFALAQEGKGEAAKRARAALTPAARGAGASSGMQQFLATVPHAEDFTLKRVPTLGVTAEQLGATYLAAWAFVHGNATGPLPGAVRYPYPQMPAGKPSLWNDGPAPAQPTAAWDSIVALQPYSLMDPEFCWGCLEGVLSLVDAEGVLHGEGLPTRLAQTLWLVYERSPNPARLRQLYPALRRFLLWKQADPYWVYGNTPPMGGTQRDLDFVASSIFDQGFAARLAPEAGAPEDVKFWQRQQSAQYANLVRWFWEPDGTGPFQYYTAGARNPGNMLWCMAALGLPGLPAAQANSLLDLFRSRFDASLPFGGLQYPKYPEMSLLVYGLLDRDQPDLAAQVVEVALRDIARAGEFSEDYTTHSAGAPQPQGVTPSCFGATMCLDFSLLHNGVRSDQGKLTRIPGL